MVYAFAAGCLLCAVVLFALPGLPPLWGWLLPALLAWRLKPSRPLLAMALAGIALQGGWSQWRAEQRLAQQLWPSLENTAQQVTGVICELPEQHPWGLTLTVCLEGVPEGLPQAPVLLQWYRKTATPLPTVLAGERWQLQVRLKRPHGLMNPGGFDRERWLWAHGLRATGSILDAQRMGMAHSAQAHLLRWREHERQQLNRLLNGHPARGIITALVIGDASAITDQDWQLFRATGITHLVSISGLHITLLAGLAASLIGWAWRRFPRLIRCLPARHAAGAAGLLMALGYALLAGYSIPTQRTLYLLAVLYFALFWRKLPLLRALAWALVVVLLFDPWAVLTAGFWLSFSAVALMSWAVVGQLGRPRWWLEWGRTQWAVTVGLLPALLWGYGQWPWLSPLANALAIPWVSLLVTPLALLGACCHSASLLHLAADAMHLLQHLLAPIAQHGLVTWPQAPLGLMILATLGALLLLAPRGLPGHWLGLIAFLPLLLWQPDKPPAGHWRARILDVGQGLAVLVETQNHRLLYDSGPAYRAGDDSGNRVIVPTLNALAIDTLDRLLLSHDDSDHTGGAASLQQQLTVHALQANRLTHPIPRPINRLPCIAGQHWQWDDVRFRVIQPTDFAAATSDNASSCVLEIRDAQHGILLTGDLESAEEEQMVRDGALAATDVVVAAHHGSNRASTAAFIDTVKPQVVMFSAGYRNRYGHPHPAVWQRYAGSARYRTDQHGMIRVDSMEDGLLIETASGLEFWRQGSAEDAVTPAP